MRQCITLRGHFSMFIVVYALFSKSVYELPVTTLRYWLLRNIQSLTMVQKPLWG